MSALANAMHWLFGSLLILSSLGVVLARKPVHASLSFLVTLLALSALYLELSAQFIAVMQVLVYAGAILVLFMFVIILFQDAHQQIELFRKKNASTLLALSGFMFLCAFTYMGIQFLGLTPLDKPLPESFGMAESLGRALYIDFFFPFEAVILLFLIAVVGSFYIGRKE